MTQTKQEEPLTRWRPVSLGSSIQHPPRFNFEAPPQTLKLSSTSFYTFRFRARRPVCCNVGLYTNRFCMHRLSAERLVEFRTPFSQMARVEGPDTAATRCPLQPPMVAQTFVTCSRRICSVPASPQRSAHLCLLYTSHISRSMLPAQRPNGSLEGCLDISSTTAFGVMSGFQGSTWTRRTTRAWQT